ncbi:MAG TPA: hypothetical protein VM639_11420 [Dongiaceae bacterium]|nr:hypothetical protein [Dongiaceae bacterium]
MRSASLVILVTLASPLIAPAALAQNTDQAKVVCQTNADLTSCDEMIAKADPRDERELAISYATRAGMRADIGDFSGAVSDIEKARSFVPPNPALEAIIQVLTSLAHAPKGLAVACSIESAAPRQRVDACSQLIDSTSGTPDVKFYYYAARATAYFDLGDIAKARADIGTSLAARPDNADFVAEDISFDYGAGDYQTALAKAEEALRQLRRPPVALALLPGQLAYLMGYHSMAIQRMTAAIHADPYDLGPSYWISLLRQEDHEDVTHNFQRMIDSFGDRAFPSKIALLLLGKLSPQMLVEAAQSLPLPIRQQRLCTAYFTIGHQAWLANDKPAAMTAFQNALQTDQSRMIEYQASKVLLQKISVN